MKLAYLISCLLVFTLLISFTQAESQYFGYNYLETPSDESTTFYPTAFQTIIGTNTSNNVTYIKYLDDIYINISETTGSPSMDVRINFTGVSDFNNVIMRLQYNEQASSHEVLMQIWNYDNDAWSTHYVIADMSGLVEINTFINQDHNHIENGLVQIRFYHPLNGNTNDKLIIDYIQLLKGTTTITTNQHDSLLGRDSEVNHPWAYPRTNPDGFIDNTNVAFLNQNNDFGANNLTTTGTVNSDKFDFGNFYLKDNGLFWKQGSPFGDNPIWNMSNEILYGRADTGDLTPAISLTDRVGYTETGNPIIDWRACGQNGFLIEPSFGLYVNEIFGTSVANAFISPTLRQIHDIDGTTPLIDFSTANTIDAQDNNITTTATILANTFIGDGSQLTGINGMDYTNLALTNQSNNFGANNLTTTGTGKFGNINASLFPVIADFSGHSTFSDEEYKPIIKWDTRTLIETDTSASEPMESGILKTKGGGVFYNSVGASEFSTIFGGGIVGDTYRRLRISADGTFNFGSGSASTDTSISRDSPQTILVTGNLTATKRLMTLTDLQVDGVGTIGASTTYPYKLLVAEYGITPEDSAVLTADSQKGRMISVQGNGAGYVMARDVTNDIESVLGTSSTGVGFLATLTNHNLQFRNNNVASWTMDTNHNLLSGSAGTSAYNITTTGGTITALAYVDLTDADMKTSFEAIDSIKNIKSTTDGKINHSTLSDFTKTTIPIYSNPCDGLTELEAEGRNCTNIFVGYQEGRVINNQVTEVINAMQGQLKAGKPTLLEDNTTALDTETTIADRYLTKSKVVELGINYAMKFLNISSITTKEFNKNKITLIDNKGNSTDYLDMEGRVVDLEGAFANHMTCLSNHKKYEDYRVCMGLSP